MSIGEIGIGKMDMNESQSNTSATNSPNSSISNRLSNAVTQGYDELIGRWQTLSHRDQVALAMLGLFLLLLVGGYGGYVLHQSANEAQQHYDEQVADYFWLRSQAGNLKTSSQNTDSTQPMSVQVQQMLVQRGISDAQIVAIGSDGSVVQLSFQHQSQALISQVLAAFVEQGWQLQRLSVEQDATSKVIQVQATLSS